MKSCGSNVAGFFFVALHNYIILKIMILFIGGTEVIFILIAVLLLFGSKKIPEVARAMGKGMREFQKATDDIKRELKDVEKNDPFTSQDKPNTSSEEKPKDAEYQ
jgi:sec-independent protein translocase protein TatA